MYWRYETAMDKVELKKYLQEKDTLHLLDFDTFNILGGNGEYQIRCNTSSTIWNATMIADYVSGKYTGIESLNVVESQENNPRDVETVMHKIREIFPNAALETDTDGQAIIYTHCKVTKTFEEID